MQCSLFPHRVNIHVVMINISHWLGAMSSQSGDKEPRIQCVPLALDRFECVCVSAGKRVVVIRLNSRLKANTFLHYLTPV